MGGAIVVSVILLVVLFFIVQGLSQPKANLSQEPHYDPHAPRSGEKRNWLVAVVGESFNNDDGTSRQAIIARCRQGEPMQLIREPDNKYDEDAIKVCRANGEQIGYIGRDDNYRFAEDLDRGHRFIVEIAFINPASGKKKNAGVVLRVAVPDEEASAAGTST
jgi:hypothetical protein